MVCADILIYNYNFLTVSVEDHQPRKVSYKNGSQL